MSQFQNVVTIQGYVQEHLPTQTGQGQRGPWTKYSALVNTGGKSPVILEMFGQNGATLAAIPVNGWVHADGSLGSRPWGEGEKKRHFMSLTVDTIYPVGPTAQPVQSTAVHGHHAQGAVHTQPLPVIHQDAPAPREQPAAPDVESIPF